MVPVKAPRRWRRQAAHLRTKTGCITCKLSVLLVVLRRAQHEVVVQGPRAQKSGMALGSRSKHRKYPHSYGGILLVSSSVLPFERLISQKHPVNQLDCARYSLECHGHWLTNSHTSQVAREKRNVTRPPEYAAIVRRDASSVSGHRLQSGMIHHYRVCRRIRTTSFLAGQVQTHCYGLPARSQSSPVSRSRVRRSSTSCG